MEWSNNLNLSKTSASLKKEEEGKIRVNYDCVNQGDRW